MLATYQSQYIALVDTQLLEKIHNILIGPQFSVIFFRKKLCKFF